MSEQTSHITLKGKLGKISYYRSKGKDKARMPGGMTKDKIMKDPKLFRVRENLSEFQGVALAVRTFRKMFLTASNFADGTLGTRTSKLFRVIMKRSQGIRGKRPVLISQQRSLLNGLELNAQESFLNRFASAFALSHTPDRSGATVTINNLVAANAVKAPISATHFKVVHILGVVADSVFDDTTNKYELATEIMQGSTAIVFSDFLALDAPAVTVALEATLPQAAVASESITVIQTLGIVFYEKIGDVYYSLRQGQAMQIVGVF